MPRPPRLFNEKLKLFNLFYRSKYMALRVAPEQWLERFNKIHSTRYDYSLAEFTGVKNIIIIICQIHGKFTQTPDAHSQGKGCNKCGIERTKVKLTKTLTQWIHEFTVVHGNKYNYSLIKNIDNGKNYISIICKQHGIFSQAAIAHKTGNGCPTCGREKANSSRRHSKETWLQKFFKVHRDRYDYSQALFTIGRTPIEIICAIHGIFEQAPELHAKGHGCKECSYDLIGVKNSKNSKNPDKWLEDFKTVHGNLYDYSLVPIIKNGGIKISIICKDHGIFSQIPYSHKAGCGCPSCGREKTSVSLLNTEKQWLDNFAKVHGNLYDYSLAQFKSGDDYIKIICHKHGVFKQWPSNHKQGQGCPNCQRSQGELYISTWLQYRKIAFTAQARLMKTNWRLSFDFFIDNYKLLLEYDGQHHFELVNFSGCLVKSQKSFKQIQKHDKIKNEWAATNDYNLIRIRYDEDIEQALTERLLPLLEVEVT